MIDKRLLHKGLQINNKEKTPNNSTGKQAEDMNRHFINPLSPLLIPPHLIWVTSNSLLPLLFSM